MEEEKKEIKKEVVNLEKKLKYNAEDIKEVINTILRILNKILSEPNDPKWRFLFYFSSQLSSFPLPSPSSPLLFLSPPLPSLSPPLPPLSPPLSSSSLLSLLPSSPSSLSLSIPFTLFVLFTI